MPMPNKPRRRVPTPGELHRSWLELVDIDGSFLSVPALLAAWPNGMHAPSPNELAVLKDARPPFEKAWDRWDTAPDDAGVLEEYREARDAWVSTVLRDVLGWNGSYTTATVDPQVRSPDYAVIVHPSGALAHNERVGALVLVTDPVDSLRSPLGDGWAASPIDRMEELLRAAGVPVGVVTDGRWWGIVSAREKALVTSGITDALTWTEAPAARNAFIELLRRPRLIGRDADGLLTTIFASSVAAAEEITEALGTQVRRAVELLVQAMSDAMLEARRRGEPDPLPADRELVYEAAVTVMMRVVFLLFAEERGLLPQGQVFTMGYGVSDELDRLDDRERDESAEVLDASFLTWHRLLATSQALYRGASFEDIRIPSYGGSLFDPDRFSFLTTCNEHGTLVVRISDRVMLEVLRAVQVARLRGQPARRISFRDIDVEQIGYIYEGLLGYSCEDATEVIVGLIGKDGEEPEIPLAKLEELSERNRTDAKLADAILAWIKVNQPAATPPSKAALAKAIREANEANDAERVLRSVTTDPGLRDRLRPFIGVIESDRDRPFTGIIRADLRDRPFVVPQGGLVVVETPSRATAGAHYTPKKLAQEVVRHALEPLVYDPGPHQRPEEDGWTPIDSDQILDLRIADIACGSGAFLVAAADYLAGRLVEAWHRDGVAPDKSPHDQKTQAIREVIANCIYGADINVMAVEMCKLSLWLVSLDPKLPFSFVDDKILHGNSLLGLTDARQLKRQHVNPDAASTQGSLFDLDVDGILRQAKALRRRMAEPVIDNDPQRSAAAKRRQWHRYQDLTADLTEVGDAVIAAGLRLGAKPGRQLQVAYENLRFAIGQAHPPQGTEPSRAMLADVLQAGLTPTVPTDYRRWKPLHWIVLVPDVMERGGFDAIIGNPPFLGGQKLTGALGANMRDWFVNVLANGKKGSADLVAYFFLRAMALLTERGNLGLIATNTVAQGDTREVGLGRMVKDGFTITRAIQSASWPVSTANLEYAAVWGTLGLVSDAAPRVVDGIEALKISALLEPIGRVDGDPVRLIENTGIAFQGCIVLGKGFVIDDAQEAEFLRQASRKNQEVVFPYLGGEDVNLRPDSSASRWVIDFNAKSEDEAKAYSLPYAHALNRVREKRQENNRQVYRDYWWQFAEKRPAMRKAIKDLSDVLVITLVSRTVMPARVRTGQVFSHKLAVFATGSFADQAILSSSIHQMWAIKYGATMRADVNYSPSDVFLTFPRPKPTDKLDEIGGLLDRERREIMLRRQLGLTKLYNLVNDPDIADEADADVARMREIHVALDHAVMDAYGWGDVELDHGFHTYRQMTRWTVSPEARVEILDRLLAENHRRAAAQGEAPPPAEDEADEGDGE
jgi:Eco57I restriction-modification methylase/restriction-modification enzyme MmeI-like protein